MKRGLVALVLLATACQDVTDTHDACKCGADETSSTLSCDSRQLCEGAFELVGHSDLGARGMNSALAIAGNYAYVGSRTDGAPHASPGVIIVDISDPTNPKDVGEIALPDEAVLGLSSRELRAVEDLNLLFVLNLTCSSAAHDCSKDLNSFPSTGGIAETENLKIYDISDRVHPVRLSRYDFMNQPDSVPYIPPHEFFLWRDKTNPARILLYVSRINGPPSLEVIDATDPRNPKKVTTWDAIVDAQLNVARSGLTSLHSLSISDDGRVGYLAHYSLGFFMIDTSSIADNVNPHVDVLTPVTARLGYSPPYDPYTHSAVKIPGRDLVLLTDEVYPVAFGDMGCPWGWSWMVDISDPRAPGFFTSTDHATGKTTIQGQLRLPYNDPSRCPPETLQLQSTYTAHNPTVTANLAIVSWHGAGLQAFDISDPVHPVQVGAFYPEPLPSVALEDPALKGTPTVMWSYPIFHNGLIYVVDIRNGLYVLRYNGPHAAEVTAQPFLEGNSNLQ